MREELKKIRETRKTFIATFKRFGKKKRYKPKLLNGEWVDYDETILLIDVKKSMGTHVADHLWINHTKEFDELGEIEEGEKISFQARVKPYVKGYFAAREGIDDLTVDYTLRYPTKFRKIKEKITKL